jgi:hypothetical protein
LNGESSSPASRRSAPAGTAARPTGTSQARACASRRMAAR